MTVSGVQLELIVHLANGMTLKEIAEATHRSPSSVEKTLNTAKKNTNSKTLAHLVSNVISMGLLEWNNDEQERELAEEENG